MLLSKTKGWTIATHNMDGLWNNYADWKKPDKKEMLCTCCMISLYRIIGNANKYSVTESRSIFAWWGLGGGNGGTRLGEITQGHWETFGGEKYIHFVDFDGGSMNIYICQNLSNACFKYVWLIRFINYSSIMLLKMLIVRAFCCCLPALRECLSKQLQL